MRVLVIGDVIIDKFHYGTALGISAETPTIVARRGEVKTLLGGAANVARHINVLGHDEVLLTLADTMDHQAGFHFVRIDGWAMTMKERFFVDGYKLLQFDQLNEGKHDDDSVLQFCDKFDALLPGFDRVVIADNRHGVLNQEIAQHIITKCNQAEKCVIVDSQVSQSKSNHDWYAGCDFMIVNERELAEMQLGWSGSAYRFCEGNNDLFNGQLLKLSWHWMCDIIVKLGEKGSYSLINGMFYRHHGHEVEVVDTCGAGDAFMAVIASGDLEDGLSETLTRANKWAALSCAERGTEIPDVKALS